jgi:hypothetical protein
MPDPAQFNTDRTYPGRWTLTFSNPPINMFVPANDRRIGSANLRSGGRTTMTRIRSPTDRRPRLCLLAQRAQNRDDFCIRNATSAHSLPESRADKDQSDR